LAPQDDEEYRLEVIDPRIIALLGRVACRASWTSMQEWSESAYALLPGAIGLSTADRAR